MIPRLNRNLNRNLNLQGSGESKITIKTTIEIQSKSG